MMKTLEQAEADLTEAKRKVRKAEQRIIFAVGPVDRQAMFNDLRLATAAVARAAGVCDDVRALYAHALADTVRVDDYTG